MLFFCSRIQPGYCITTFSLPWILKWYFPFKSPRKGIWKEHFSSLFFYTSSTSTSMSHQLTVYTCCGLTVSLQINQASFSDKNETFIFFFLDLVACFMRGFYEAQQMPLIYWSYKPLTILTSLCSCHIVKVSVLSGDTSGLSTLYKVQFPMFRVTVMSVFCRWVHPLEQFQLCPCYFSRTGRLFSFCSFTGSLPSLGKSYFFN